MKQNVAMQYHNDPNPEGRVITQGSLWRGIKITGFPNSESEEIRAMLSRIPYELLTHVKAIRRALQLGAKHGRYIPETQTILVNPHTFVLEQRFGKGDGWIEHAELMIVHEVGHSVYEYLPESKKQEWLKLSGWVKGDKKGNAPRYVEKRPGWPPYTSEWTHKKGLQFPRGYSEKNPDEHWADCFAFYILGKKFQMAPAMREYMDRTLSSMIRVYPGGALIEGPSKP